VFVWRNRSTASPDRIIAAIIATAPLLMPYYLDYDLLLLAVPAVLLAGEMVGREPARLIPGRDRWLIRLWIGFYLLLLINPALTQASGFNLAVPMLAAIATISILRIRPEQIVLLGTAIIDDEPRILRIGSAYHALAS
jgi:hypothetical protein